MKLYITRYFESTANRLGILASRQHFPLSEKGQADAIKAAKVFAADHKVNRIFSSPLIRAVQTANAFASAFGLMVEIQERLTEQELGIFAGMSYNEIEKARGYEHRRDKRWDWVPEGGGESYSMIYQRVLPLFNELSISANQNQSVFIVTHAVTLRIIRAILENTIPFYPVEIAKNGGIWEASFTRINVPTVVRPLNFSGIALKDHRA